MELTAFDKELLNLLQGHLPVCSRPFARLAEELGTEESVVLQRVQELKREGYLRRIGTFFDSNKLGYHGTLVALRVEPEHIPSTAFPVPLTTMSVRAGTISGLPCSRPMSSRKRASLPRSGPCLAWRMC